MHMLSKFENCIDDILRRNFFLKHVINKERGKFRNGDKKRKKT
jgi:hypothetical protein